MFNRLRANSFQQKYKPVFAILSLLYTDMTQVVEILPHVSKDIPSLHSQY